MGGDILNIFPYRGLDQSILVAVLVGIWTLFVFTEMFGWVFVGLVVPGYLASILVIQPLAALAVVVEAVVTYAIARFISDRLNRFGAWSMFFGRGRFFLIILVSVIVRQNSQVWILPDAAALLDQWLATDLEAAHEYSSIGLVLVPLLANMFWKTGFVRGVVQTAFPVAITYAVLALVLLPYTNLSLSSLEVTYENVAIDFLSSPKAYIILITTGYLAARSNVLYGWDYNGILVPSLLALCWFSPQIILVTLAEVGILVVTTLAVLALPYFRTLNVEGPRRVTLIFTLGFGLKFAFGWLAADYLLDAKATDFFGFGYVLTSLIAVKILQTKRVARVILPTLHVSLLGIAAGSIVGFGLELMAPTSGIAVSQQSGTTPTMSALADPVGAVAVGVARARARPRAVARRGPPPRERKAYARIWRDIDGWLEAGGTRGELSVSEKADQLGLRMRPLRRGFSGRRTYVLLENEERLTEQRGWDTAVLVPGAPGPVIEVPRPRLERPTAGAATIICARIQCRAIVIAGVDSGDDGATAGDAAAHPRATLAIARRALTSAPVVQLRRDNSLRPGDAVLHLPHSVPAKLDLNRLWSPAPRLSWDRPNNPTPARWGARRDVVVLRIGGRDLWKAINDDSPPLKQISGSSAAAWLSRQWRGLRGLDLPPRPRPSETELRVIESLIAPTLLQRRADHMQWAARIASSFGYQIAALTDCRGPGRGCWLLSEESEPARLRWGTLLVDQSQGEPIAVEVPRAGVELGVRDLSVGLWDMMNAEILVVGHESPVLSESGARILRASVRTPVHALHQAVHRSLARRGPDPLILQMRGYGSWRPITSDVVIGVGPPVLEDRQIPKRLTRLLSKGGGMSWLQTGARYARGEKALVALAGQGNPQLAFSRAVGRVDMAIVWFSRAVRDRYTDRGSARTNNLLTNLGMKIENRSPVEFLLAPFPPARQTGSSRRRSVVLPDVVHFAETRDVRDLVRARSNARSGKEQLVTGWSDDIGQHFLGVDDSRADNRQRTVVLLGSSDWTCRERVRPGPHRKEDVRRLVTRRCRIITVTDRERSAPR